MLSMNPLSVKVFGDVKLETKNKKYSSHPLQQDTNFRISKVLNLLYGKGRAWKGNR